MLQGLLHGAGLGFGLVFGVIGAVVLLSLAHWALRRWL
jgi:hypothetical protein